jgi:hypothetical protein
VNRSSALRPTKDYILKHARFGILNEIKRETTYTEANRERFVNWNVASNVSKVVKNKLNNFIFGPAIIRRPVMFVEYEDIVFVYL